MPAQHHSSRAYTEEKLLGDGPVTSRLAEGDLLTIPAAQRFLPKGAPRFYAQS